MEVCGELKLYFSSSAGGLKKKKKKTFWPNKCNTYLCGMTLVPTAGTVHRWIRLAWNPYTSTSIDTAPNSAGVQYTAGIVSWHMQALSGNQHCVVSIARNPRE